MAKIVIHTAKCKGCLLCVSFCPRKLISAEDKINRKGVRAARLNKSGQCLGCAICALVCPDSCIEVYK